jgi:uncharacterized membrane protein
MPLPKVTATRVLGFATTALAAYAVWIAMRGMSVLAHGGVKDFDGAFDYPAWAIVHFAPALVFAAILPLQLWPRVRDTHPRVHRLAGRIAATCGTIAAVAGVPLVYVMPARPLGERVFMTTVGIGFLTMLWRGVAAARRGDSVSHRAWMLRATAGGLSAIVQRVIFPFFAAAGIDSMARFWDLFLAAAWLATAINFTVVEWWIHRTSLSGRELHWNPLRNEAALEGIHQ